jgi:hypothetical protein
MVRGHWRKHWQHPPNPLCAHVWTAQGECERCHGQRFWIPEHPRGDERLGFVTHDYAVTHSDEA